MFVDKWLAYIYIWFTRLIFFPWHRFKNPQIISAVLSVFAPFKALFPLHTPEYKRKQEEREVKTWKRRERKWKARDEDRVSIFDDTQSLYNCSKGELPHLSQIVYRCHCLCSLSDFSPDGNVAITLLFSLRKDLLMFFLSQINRNVSLSTTDCWLNGATFSLHSETFLTIYLYRWEINYRLYADEVYLNHKQPCTQSPNIIHRFEKTQSLCPP